MELIYALTLPAFLILIAWIGSLGKAKNLHHSNSQPRKQGKFTKVINHPQWIIGPDRL